MPRNAVKPFDSICCRNASNLQHDNTYTTAILLVQFALLSDSTIDRCSPPVKQIEVQLAVSRAKLLLVEEESVVEEGESVEHVEFELHLC